MDQYPMQANERIMHSHHQPGQGYMASPPTGYGQPAHSPDYSAHHMMSGGPLGQSPPNTPGGMRNPMRHRSTLSGSSDAGLKQQQAQQAQQQYRKLQPAPVPAHRAWSSRQELKTIPYDHKETGSAAQLPSSGPTQIRGWSVNQHRKRGKTDKGDRGDAPNEREESR